jgi:peptide-methionine (R)-S-oxide reductase
MNRRHLLTLLGALGISHPLMAATPAAKPQTVEPLRLSDSEWKKRLTADQYAVLRDEGTERPLQRVEHGEAPGCLSLRRL